MDNMDKIIDVVDENGVKHKIEIIDIFNVEGYDHDYVLYTQNVEVDDENIEAYVSILNMEGDNCNLLNISDEEEWDVVHNAILEMGG